MKGTSLVVSIVLFIAVVVLYILYFTGIKSEAPVADGQSTAEEQHSLRIAYVKTDSLILNYDLAQDLHDEFTKKQEAYTKEYAAKRSAFEKEAAAFQEKVKRGGFLTEQRAIQERDRLMGKEQEIVKLDKELSSKLSDIQAENNKKLLDNVINYLKKYNETHNYDYILNASNILIGDESYNITALVLNALNEEYQASKGTK
ncbi:MAG: OmpH family outer membrane protein [Chlorobi bacterium]|nr:OmpH family outer membrane protein [Chlorobiota bacterium]